jgi:hypothetical protein
MTTLVAKTTASQPVLRQFFIQENLVYFVTVGVGDASRS